LIEASVRIFALENSFIIYSFHKWCDRIKVGLGEKSVKLVGASKNAHKVLSGKYLKVRATWEA
jgi:hypothetical protein